MYLSLPCQASVCSVTLTTDCLLELYLSSSIFAQKKGYESTTHSHHKANEVSKGQESLPGQSGLMWQGKHGSVPYPALADAGEASELTIQLP